MKRTLAHMNDIVQSFSYGENAHAVLPIEPLVARRHGRNSKRLSTERESFKHFGWS